MYDRTVARAAAFVAAAFVVASLPAVAVARNSERSSARPVPGPTPTLPDLLNSPSPTPSPTPAGSPRPEEPVDGGPQRPRPRPDEPTEPPLLPGERVPGAYNTLRLLGAAAQLRALGWSEEDVTREVFVPFIVAGYASWTDTWNAHRFGPGPIVRRHEGQDVFCDYGSPVLAPEAGVVTFDSQPLGGLIARVHRVDGSYWYLAHLSDWNTDQFRSGATVAAGDVIGYCGSSGNAELTPPHVHFGWYGAGGARNPMQPLIDWLRVAETRAEALLVQVTGERIARISELETYRRFGDAFTPDRTELPNPGEALWASGSSPVSGVFGVAQVALQRALSQPAQAPPGPVRSETLPPDGDSAPIPSATLAELLSSFGYLAFPQD